MPSYDGLEPTIQTLLRAIAQREDAEITKRRDPTPVKRKADYYVLLNNKPVREDDATKWQQWMAHSRDRFVGLDRVGDVTISTAFIGAAPVGQTSTLWQTVFFGSEQSEQFYGTFEAALEGHQKAVAGLRGGRPMRFRE